MNAGKFFAILGAILQVATLYGVSGTVFGMFQTFDSITDYGSSNSEVLPEGISSTLVTTQVCLIIGYIGFVFMLFALVGLHYRSKWYYWFMIIYSIASLCSFPVGTIVH